MADKGGTGTDIFKLIVKVELLGKSKVNEHVIEQLQKAFQGQIANLRQHLQSYPELQSQHIHCVTNKKKYLGFEFWLRSAQALEQLKLSTENEILVNALSDFSEKKAMGLDIGLGSQHLCFKCKIEGKHYTLGLAHFMESSSESSAEEFEDADDQPKQSHEPQGAASGTEPKEKQEMTGKDQANVQPQGVSSSAETKQEKVFGGLQREEMVKKSTSQETSKVKEMASFFEPNSGTGKDAQINDSTQSENNSQLKRKNTNELEGAQDVLPGHTVEEVSFGVKKVKPVPEYEVSI